jgi:hypothetical protein
LLTSCHAPPPLLRAGKTTQSCLQAAAFAVHNAHHTYLTNANTYPVDRPACPAATPSPLTLESNLTSLNSQLALPPEGTQLLNSLLDAASALDGSASLMADLAASLRNVSSLVAAMGADAAAIGTALSDYVDTAGPWGDVQTALSAGAPNVAAAAEATHMANSDAGAKSAPLADVATRMSGFEPQRQAVAGSLGGVIADVNAAPDLSQFASSLDGVQPAYAALGSPPSQVRLLAGCRHGAGNRLDGLAGGGPRAPGAEVAAALEAGTRARSEGIRPGACLFCRARCVAAIHSPMCFISLATTLKTCHPPCPVLCRPPQPGPVSHSVSAGQHSPAHQPDSG